MQISFRNFLQPLITFFVLGINIHFLCTISAVSTQLKMQDVDWIYLTWVRGQRWAFVNTIMNLRLSCKMTNFLTLYHGVCYHRCLINLFSILTYLNNKTLSDYGCHGEHFLVFLSFFSLFLPLRSVENKASRPK